jgi:aspartate-semialdehyde dehydrogenase
MHKILIVDPTTLLGREALALLQREPLETGAVSFVHTAGDDEHEIVELAGQPALVPPLTDPDQLAGFDAVLVASDTETARGSHVARFLEEHPSAPVVVMGHRSTLHEHTVPAAGAATNWPLTHVHVVHPALVALWSLASCLSQFEPSNATIAAIDPVSVRGTEAVERLARQAAKRLQGALVEETIEGRVLAFTAVATDDDDLNRDAAALMPDLSVSATRIVAGFFHGHQSHIGMVFDHEATEHDVLDALRADERFADPDLPISLDAATDSDQVLLSLPRLAADGRTMAVSAMADGLRVGGALTALQILRSLI